MAERATGKEIEMSTAKDTNPRILIAAIGLAILALALAVLGASASTAGAAEGILKAEIKPTETQAGGHPDVKFTYEWAMRQEAPIDPCHCEDARLVITDTPTGFVGNPHAVPKCTLDAYALGECAEEAQVGFFNVQESKLLVTPIYNMVTRPDQAGLVAFTVPGLNVPVFMDISSRTESDYGLVTTVGPIYHILAINETEITLWGVPADPKNDEKRFKTPLAPVNQEGGAKSNAPLKAYLHNPTTCGAELHAKVTVEYYTGNKVSTELPYPATTGCDSLSFNPSLTAQPTTEQADTATGIDINLKVPQVQSPTTPAPSEIRSSVVTLPPGFSINPGAADGKVACSDFDSAIGRTRGPATCPEYSKIGSATIDSAALPGPITGGVFLGEPLPGDRYRMFLTADGFGTHVKLPGSIRPDPQSGRLVVQFVDLPQTPLSEFDMHIFGSERGSMVTPTRCGSYPVESEFVPWDESLPIQKSKSFFSITSGPGGGPCPGSSRPFDPRFDAGTANATAGMHTPFNMRVARPDGDQNLVRLDVKAPPGFAATLRGIPYCPEAAIVRLLDSDYQGRTELAAPACPAASEIGGVVAGAGPGTHPLHLGGKAYLAGPYRGAPLSLVAVIPAVSGPYDLGVVAVRAGVFVDPRTAQVSAVSDALPTIKEGIPLRTRLVEVNLNRPGFAFNPTNCDPFSVDGTLFGSEGAVAPESNHFQVANCADLPYAPKLNLALRGNLKRRGHPAIHAVLVPRSGEANTRRVAVTLPKGQLLDDSHIGTICTRVAFARDACPEGSLYGHARAYTPVLDRPLEGPLYLRSSRNKLPDIVVDLRGQIGIELVGRVDSVKGRFKVTFAALPDTPVSRFVLDMKGGKRGLLENSEALCKRTKRALVRMVGQNGMSLTRRPKLSMSCGAGESRNDKRRRLSRAMVVR